MRSFFAFVVVLFVSATSSFSATITESIRVLNSNDRGTDSVFVPRPASIGPSGPVLSQANFFQFQTPNGFESLRNTFNPGNVVLDSVRLRPLFHFEIDDTRSPRVDLSIRYAPDGATALQVLTSDTVLHSGLNNPSQRYSTASAGSSADRPIDLLDRTLTSTVDLDAFFSGSPRLFLTGYATNISSGGVSLREVLDIPSNEFLRLDVVYEYSEAPPVPLPLSGLLLGAGLLSLGGLSKLRAS